MLVNILISYHIFFPPSPRWENIRLPPRQSNRIFFQSAEEQSHSDKVPKSSSRFAPSPFPSELFRIRHGRERRENSPGYYSRSVIKAREQPRPLQNECCSRTLPCSCIRYGAKVKIVFILEFYIPWTFHVFFYSGSSYSTAPTSSIYLRILLMLGIGTSFSKLSFRHIHSGTAGSRPSREVLSLEPTTPFYDQNFSTISFGAINGVRSGWARMLRSEVSEDEFGWMFNLGNTKCPGSYPIGYRW